jgi:hypothetical protein
MHKLRVDKGVLLIGVRLKYSPFCLELFIGRIGWLLFGVDDIESRKRECGVCKCQKTQKK